MKAKTLRPVQHFLETEHGAAMVYTHKIGATAVSAMLPAERKGEVISALSSSDVTVAMLHNLCDALGLKKTFKKIELARVIGEQCVRGIPRGVTLRGDCVAAIYKLVKWTRHTATPFEEFWVQLHYGREQEFLKNPSSVAREVWRHKLPLAHKDPRAFYTSQDAFVIAAYFLYSPDATKVAAMSEEDKHWLTWMTQYDAPVDAFEGEKCWWRMSAIENGMDWPEVNRMALQKLKPANMLQVFEERAKLPQSEQAKYVGPNGEKVDYSFSDIHAACLTASLELSYLMREKGVPSQSIAHPAKVVNATSSVANTSNAFSEQSLNAIVAVLGQTLSGNENARQQPSLVAALTPKVANTAAVEMISPTTAPEQNKEVAMFYARLDKADPMYETISSKDNPSYPPGILLLPQKVLSSKTFQQCFFLSASDLNFLQREGEFELQAVCMLQNDDVKERLQWPLDVYLTVNDSNMQVPRRSTVKSVTKSTRDPVVIIPASRLRSGSNHLRMFHRDKRDNFMFAVRIVKKRTLADVAANIPKASSEAVALKNALNNLGFTKLDDDDIIMEDVALFSLRCPISGQVFKTPARLSSCQGLHAFDASSFLELNIVSRKWACPECGKRGGPSELRVDSFIKHCAETITARGLDKASRIEIDKEGRWRPREEAGAPMLQTDQLRWYSPTITKGVVEWTLEKGDEMSLASTATKIGGDEPESSNVQSTHIAATRGGDDDDDDAELDEAEEYRRAIREAAEFGGVSPKPVKAKTKEPDVIVISDSEDESPNSHHVRPRVSDPASRFAAGAGSAAKRPKPSSQFPGPKLTQWPFPRYNL